MTHFPLKIFPSSSWRTILRKNFTRVERLADFLELNKEQREQLVKQPDFPLQVPLRLAQKMVKGSLDDPLVKQFLPLAQEQLIHPQFVLDPVCDDMSKKKENSCISMKGVCYWFAQVPVQCTAVIVLDNILLIILFQDLKKSWPTLKKMILFKRSF